MTVSIACIVEGHGEIESLPILVRRIAQAQHPSIEIRIPTVIRRSRGALLKDGVLENDAGLAASKIGGRGGILVVIDSDDDCPATEAPKLFARLHGARSDLPSAIVLAKFEFEAWFLAGAESLRGKHRLPSDLVAPPNPEAIRGAKEWLKERMPPGQKYSATVDQPALSALLDLDMAEARSRSFRKLRKEVMKLCLELQQPAK